MIKIDNNYSNVMHVISFQIAGSFRNHKLFSLPVVDLRQAYVIVICTNKVAQI